MDDNDNNFSGQLGALAVIECEPRVRARYVVVQTRITEVMNLCEITIHGNL